MTAVGLGQQGSQAVGSGIESLSSRIFTRFIPNIFRYSKETLNGSFTKISALKRQTIFHGKFWYFLTPPSPLSINFFATRNFVKHRRVSLRSFSIQWDNKFFCRKTWYSPLSHKIFRFSQLSETRNGSSTNWFGTLRQNNFDRKSWYPPPILWLTFFNTRNFLKHRRVPVRIFRHSETNVFHRKSRYFLPTLPPLVSKNFFDTRNFVKHRRVPLRSFSVLWDKKFSTENLETLRPPPPYP